MKQKKTLFLGLFLYAGLLHAQTDFRPGYIINHSGDTLHGEVDYRGDLLMSKVCRFKDDNGTISEYYPNNIFAYRLIGSKFYESRKLNGREVFLEYLIKGEINIYYIRDEAGDHYYLDKKGVPLIEIPYEEGTKYVDDKEVFYTSKKHIGILSYYMQDAPRLQSQILSLKEPQHQNLIKLAEDYHNAVCDGEKCIIYEKQQPSIKVNLEVVAGSVKIRQNDKSYFQRGIFAHFWMPRTNEKLYIKTGLLYSQPEQDGEKAYDYLKIPVHIGYLAPNTYSVRPSISIGLMSPSYSGGVLFKISNMVNFGIQTWMFFDFEKVPFIPKQLTSYSVLGSLYIEF